ncbi:helix-turn-helix domain-containing protein [Solwaraspora sp. WMMB335]|uniref:helix-turn-helix domain-containing protein n=1 Tax=Solwaraspora sp. WMMB335 TaxID=3404118 RepID=UPI003B95E844
MQLGARLRRLRENKGITREDAGWVIRASESKISRMELGRVGFKERDVDDLLTIYGVTDEQERAELVTLARQSNQPGWWQPYGDLLPTWFQYYLDLESAASLIRTYEIQFVPGLLQTEEYARAVIGIGFSEGSAQEVERRVALRIARKQVLDQPDAPRVWAVIDEAVLCRPIGGSKVLRGQIEALAESCERPGVRLQVVRFRSGGHAAAGGAFSILRFPEQELPDVVYLEHLTSALYLDKREDVDRYAAAAGRLFIEADPPDRTRDILHAALRDL